MQNLEEFVNPPFDGQSTKWEVEQLMEQFGSSVPGTAISDLEVEEASKTSKEKMNRFRTVTDSWRRKMFRDKNLLVLRQKNEGFLIACNGDRVNDSSGRLDHIKRMNRKIFKISSSTSETDLTSEQILQRRHQVLLSSRINQKFKEEEKQLRIVPPEPVKQLTK